MNGPANRRAFSFLNAQGRPSSLLHHSGQGSQYSLDWCQWKPGKPSVAADAARAARLNANVGFTEKIT